MNGYFFSVPYPSGDEWHPIGTMAVCNLGTGGPLRGDELLVLCQGKDREWELTVWNLRSQRVETIPNDAIYIPRDVR